MFRQEAKSGISLVVVMLFMLVATIAATATYKWITSEGSTSANVAVTEPRMPMGSE
jgi:Tfp pilus assembly protein PilX